MSHLRFAHLAYVYPAAAATALTAIPPSIMAATPAPSSAATNSGPGVGGTSEWVIVAPATMHSTYSV